MHNNGVLDYKAGSTKLLPDSTCEAEAIWGSKGAKATVAARTSLEDMGIGATGPTPLLGDNKALNDLVKKPGATARTKYYERAVLIVKRLYTLLVVSPFLVLTKFMVADIFTKALDRDAFITFRDYMLNVENGPEPYARGKAGRLLDKLMSALHK